MTEETTPQPQGSGETVANQFALQRIYVKDISFESPMPITGRSQAQPGVSQDLNTTVTKVSENHFEVVLNLTVTVKQEEKTAFLVEVHQAGLFQVSGFEPPQLQHLLSSTCPTILFPYAREAVDNMAIRGGFPPIMLPPLNFDALYAKALEEAKARGEKEGESTTDIH